MWGNEVPARASASPGLLRRRYSVPETIMRKYRLAQQRSEGEGDETGRWSASGAAAGTRSSCAWCGARAGAKREREHMRKSALLRLWGRAGASPARACPCVPCPPFGTRSLDASHSELRTSPRRLRLDSRDRHSDCSSVSPARAVSSCTDPIPDIAREISPRRITESRIVQTPVESPALQIETIDRSLTSSSDAFTTSIPTTKENPYKTLESYTHVSTSEFIDGRVSERSISAENDESNMVSYARPLTIESPSYDVLEIIVSETLDVKPMPSIKTDSPEKVLPAIKAGEIKYQISNIRKPNMDLDEYVSNILVESLNSLTDQLESMNASMGSDRKLSIVEKEIKVKLQNTGVNTIVHLSPTSNNQIIFGNEELYENDGRCDDCNNPNDPCSVNIREETHSVETNNNFTSADSLRHNDKPSSYDKTKSENFLNISNETVNKAVLQQIQKLFQEELNNIEPEINSPDGPLPGISHIEISNVDVFLDNNGGIFPSNDTIEMQTKRNSGIEVIGGVGTGNYYQEVDDNAVVPRFSAFPHTESMEVNTSSSEDAELLGSECASLVDSLDDPNSPRSILLRKSYNSNKRSELVRSAIDVLELLPEDANRSRTTSPKEKGESFFIRIKDDNCDCDKENIKVADHMPETIKQRLYRRHRKREMRMETARRIKVKQLKRDLDTQNLKEVHRTKKEIERECMFIINSIIDDVIAKIAQDEYKCMRISQRSNKLSVAKSDENLLKKQWKRDSENNNNRSSRKSKNIVSNSRSSNLEKDRPEHRKGERINREKNSLQTNPPSSPEDSGPKRIYQKSEIRDGNKCIEILEILEYVNSSHNSDTTTSDENHNLSSRNRKSRIPIPVNDTVQRIAKGTPQKGYKTNGSRRTPPILSSDRNGKSHLLANMLFDALSENEIAAHDVQVRRASVPCESRARSNSLRFKNVFDIIPEERSSLSLESTGDDSYNRRASAPSLSEFHSTDQEDKQRTVESNKYRELKYSDTKNAGTSPMPDLYRAQLVNVSAMTSPIRKSAGTSPIRITSGESRVTSDNANKQGQPKLSRRVQKHEGGPTRRKSVSSQYEPTRRLRGGHSENETIPSIFRLKRGKKSERQSLESNSVSERRSSVEAPPRERNKNRTRNVLGIPRKDKKDHERVNGDNGLQDREGEGDEWSSSESSGSLLCSLAPAWLTARRRRRRAAPSGEWAVTVAGSCPAALPNDVEMRLRFPDPRRRNSTASEQTPRPPPPPPPTCHRAVDCSAQCTQSGHTRRVIDDASRLTLTVKKEASDSSIVASKSVKKSSDVLPDLHTYRASRSKTRSSVKTRRGYSLHCWLPEDEPTPIRARNGLAVEGNAIVPKRKPRAPSMSERDLTRGLPPRLHLPLHLRNIF